MPTNGQRHAITLACAAAAVLVLGALGRVARPENALPADRPRFLYPAGRTTYSAGEKFAAWLHIPGGRAARSRGGRGELSLYTPAGTITTLTEDIAAGPGALTLAYSIDSGQLSPGRYGLRFTCNGVVCEAAFTVAESVPATEFPITAPAGPAGEFDAARWRDLRFNYALIADPASLNADALALAGARWLKELLLKADASPADPAMVAAGTAAVQQAVQADYSAAGFSGLAITALPSVPPAGSRGDPLMAAFIRRAGAVELPADPVIGFDQWRRFLEFRENCWPEALRAWGDAARAANPAAAFAVPAADIPAQGQATAEFAIIRATDGPAAGLQLLTDAALARSRLGSGTLWAMLPPRKPGDPPLRQPFSAALAAGVKGIIYPPEALAGTERAYVAGIAALNRKLLLHGNLLLALQPAPSDVAVLHSQTSEFFNAARAVAGQKAPSHARRVASAWAACALAGHPARIIDEHAIRDGALRQYKAVVLPGISRLPDDVAAALRALADDGGLVIIDADGPEITQRAVRAPFAFPDSAGLPDPQIIEALRAFAGARNLARPTAICSRPDWIITQLSSGGDDRFFYVLSLSNVPDPQSADVLVPAEGAVYDVFSGREAAAVPLPGDAGARIVQVKLAAGQAKLFAILPARIGSVGVQAPVLRERQLAIAASLLDDAGRPLKADASAEILVTEESGLERYRIYRQFRRGKLDITLPMATNERPGRWQLRVTELFSGRSQAIAFTVRAWEVGGVVRPGDMVDTVRREQCRNLLKAAKSLTIVVGDAAGDAAVQDLARRLARFGVRSEITKDKPSARGSGFALDGDAIIVGMPATSPLVKRIGELGLLPIRVGTEFIGAGRALVFFVQSPITPSARAIVLCAADAAGYSRGAESLAMMCADREPEPSRFPTVAVGIPAPPPAGEPVEELLPAFTLDVGEPVAAVATPANGRVIFAATISGWLHAFTSEGVPAWRQRIGEPARHILLPVGDPCPIVIGDTSASVFSLVSTRKAFIHVTGKRDAPGIARAAVSPDGSVIVLAAPGALLAFDSSGKQLWKRPTDAAVGTLAVGNDRTACADAKQVACLNAKGGSFFSAKLADCTALAFSRDAGLLFAGSRSGLVRCFTVPAGKMLWEGKFDAPVVAIALLASDQRDFLAAAVLDNGQVVDLATPPAPGNDAAGGVAPDHPAISLGHPVDVAAETPDRLCFATASAGGRLSVVSWDWRVRRFRFAESAALPAVPISSIALAAGARTIVIGDSSGAVHVCRFR
ncbi:MAG TPA: PQQ-binding-like beta-propeller repeat protein [Planctomycetota bacterium]|nr:PQQ-binding-like beta-propeller repeat protein [Planctomycetota bacterium]